MFDGYRCLVDGVWWCMWMVLVMGVVDGVWLIDCDYWVCIPVTEFFL